MSALHVSIPHVPYLELVDSLTMRCVDTGKAIVVGFNTGMASGDDALKLSWQKDIAWLLDRRILSLFTCANDYNDLKCEDCILRS